MVLLATFRRIGAPYDTTDMRWPPLNRPSLCPIRSSTDRFVRAVLTSPSTSSSSVARLGPPHNRISLRRGHGSGLARRYRGGATDLVIVRACYVLFSFPTRSLCHRSPPIWAPVLDNAALGIAVVYAPHSAVSLRRPGRSPLGHKGSTRLVPPLGLRRRTASAVVFRHILPNVLAPAHRPGPR